MTGLHQRRLRIMSPIYLGLNLSERYDKSPSRPIQYVRVLANHHAPSHARNNAPFASLLTTPATVCLPGIAHVIRRDNASVTTNPSQAVQVRIAPTEDQDRAGQCSRIRWVRRSDTEHCLRLMATPTWITRHTWTPSSMAKVSASRASFTAERVVAGPNSAHAKAANAPLSQLIWSPDQASQFVEDVFSNGSDYLKIIAEENGPSQATQNAPVLHSHARSREVMTHAALLDFCLQANKSRADGPGHIPYDALLNDTARWWRKSMVLANTTELQILDPNAAVPNFTSLMASSSKYVRNMRAKEIPILAGPESSVGQCPSSLPFGEYLHDELANFLDIDMISAAAVNAATLVPALLAH
ncbi:hypothetical protein BAUCODRAFT_22999 [Baudoinia panamericana UAMH 10762]|uniref:Uncharacterized protein n=1 Tax=Baudoinia panamericana (strain UAMH 10762) TaxID=717646 RepID=M2MNC2_BAUPA|nr:uncharacterized protein BAUCODRAFT_22999 [Baudoinia panamericana UAMH 10762]EMC98181.1 hypothetical protein BAUCODRAFT_22999 [Baudoinia panamericana UAMH 10762]